MKLLHALVFVLVFSLASFNAPAEAVPVTQSFKYSSINDRTASSESSNSDNEVYAQLKVTEAKKSELNNAREAGFIKAKVEGLKNTLKEANDCFQKKTAEGVRNGYRVLLKNGILDVNDQFLEQTSNFLNKNQTQKEVFLSLMSQMGYHSDNISLIYFSSIINTFGIIEGAVLFQSIIFSNASAEDQVLSLNAAQTVVGVAAAQLRHENPALSCEDAIKKALSLAMYTPLFPNLDLDDQNNYFFVPLSVVMISATFLTVVDFYIVMLDEFLPCLVEIGLAFTVIFLIIVGLVIVNALVTKHAHISYIVNDSPQQTTYNPHSNETNFDGVNIVHVGKNGYEMPGATAGVQFVQSSSDMKPIAKLFTVALFGSKSNTFIGSTTLGGVPFQAKGYGEWFTMAWSDDHDEGNSCNVAFSRFNEKIAQQTRNKMVRNIMTVISKVSSVTNQNISLSCYGDNTGGPIAYNNFGFHAPIEYAPLPSLLLLSSSNSISPLTKLEFPSVNGTSWTVQYVYQFNNFGGHVPYDLDQMQTVQFQVTHSDDSFHCFSVDLSVRTDPGLNAEIILSPSLMLADGGLKGHCKTRAAEFMGTFSATHPQLFPGTKAEMTVYLQENSSKVKKDIAIFSAQSALSPGQIVQ